MKTSKGFIAPLLLAFIALLLIGGGAYMYVQKQGNQSAIVTPTTQATSTTQLQGSSGKILLGDSARYENLSAEEKRIVESYHNEVMRVLDEEIKKEGLNPATYENDQPITGCMLKYYDSRKVFIGCAVPKPGFSINFVDRNTWKNIGENGDNLNFWNGYVESENYLIFVDDYAGVSYFKTGDSDITLVPNSKPAKGETYVESVGMADTYSVAFDELTKTLMISIYKDTGGANHQKLRTVKFVLP